MYVVVNFLFQLIFTFPLPLGTIMYANEFETKGNKSTLTVRRTISKGSHEKIGDCDQSRLYWGSNPDLCDRPTGLM